MTDCLGDYEEWVRGLFRPDRPGNDLEHAVFGIAEEAGELLGKLKRRKRGDYDGEVDPEAAFRAAASAELGDLLWYVVAAAERLGLTLEEVAVRNKEKLLARFARQGGPQGEGDDR